ncbi:MAG TPA: UDP-N-acetylmuramoyl-L-alanyl-D-glutamate--2,6-diaminopimelate ligase, partial [Gammaproteobacteria bacterium]|nr:UDP-N-acetylmuramoyl-L-alanyl-D-glutamate--2,6-diaminopimelate ligase [Gammaproteobacteria bacterium]
MMAAQATTPGPTLQSLLQGIATVPGTDDVPLPGITSDSRRVQPGWLFVAYVVPGQSNIEYINDAIRAGAAAVVAEHSAIPAHYLCPVPLVRVRHLQKSVGILADRFYSHPSANMTVIGVTGTNGKTSVSHMLARSLSELTGIPTGLVGTLGCGLLPDLQPGLNTTPEAISLQAMLANMRDGQASHVVLEVSSHGVDQQRIAGVHFAMAILTNVSRDHLDYHRSMKNYVAVKRRLFTDYDISKVVVNLDDTLGLELARSLPGDVQLMGYTLDQQRYADNGGRSCIYGQIRQQQLGNMQIHIRSPRGEAMINSRLFGRHNASNLLAALSALCLLDIPLEKSIRALEQYGNVPGRLECINKNDSATFVVDYAHTPDALRHVLQTLKALCNGRLYCIFGCGGERDKGKRAQMGEVAAQFADSITLTNDNPRREDPDEIITAIKSGTGAHERVNVITDRKQAILAVSREAGPNDIVLVAGKGHEKYQDINGDKQPFSDQQVIRELLEDGA